MVGHILVIEERVVTEQVNIKSLSWLNSGDCCVDYSDEQLIQAWKELLDEERLILYLIDVEQLSLRKTAAIMDMSASVVKNRSDQARAELKEKLRSCCQRAKMLYGQ